MYGIFTYIWVIFKEHMGIILIGGLEHVLFSPIVGMMIQSDSYFSMG